MEYLPGEVKKGRKENGSICSRSEVAGNRIVFFFYAGSADLFDIISGMFPPCSPPSSSALLLATAAAVVLVASSVASPVSREADIEAIEQPAPSKRLKWRTIEGDANDYDGDALDAGFRDVSPEALKRFLYKRIPIHKRNNSGLTGFHGDTFSDGFGDFATVKKRFTNSFHGDTFSDGFGEFATV